MSEVKAKKRGAGGRPRLLTREQVVARARALGLEGLTMTRLAADLGVTVATLYQYVADRDDVLRLAAAEIIRTLPFPQDHGQGWADYMREFAEAVVGLLSSDRHMLSRFAQGEFSAQAEAQLMEGFLAAMMRRGFAADQAYALLQQVSAVALGVAVLISRRRHVTGPGREGGGDDMAAPLLHAMAPDGPFAPPPDMPTLLAPVIAYFGAMLDQRRGPDRG